MNDQQTEKQEPQEVHPQWADELHDGLSNMGNELHAGAEKVREELHTSRRRSRDGWIWGIVLILGGGLLLLQNLTNFQLNNWWALFILLPAVGSFSDAWSRYQDEGRFNRRVRGSVVSGIIFLGISLFFLMNLNLGRYWSVWLIVGGVIILVNAILPD